MSGQNSKQTARESGFGAEGVRNEKFTGRSNQSASTKQTQTQYGTSTDAAREEQRKIKARRRY